MLDIGLVMAEGGLASGLDTLNSVYTWLMGCLSTLVNTIASTPLLLLPVGIMATGAVIGLGKRFIGR